jgi:hypothetical protein
MFGKSRPAVTSQMAVGLQMFPRPRLARNHRNETVADQYEIILGRLPKYLN